MSTRTIIGTLLFAALGWGLAGCYDDPVATLHEAGEYKGPEDPLLDRLAEDTELRSELASRVEQQTDR